MIKLTKTAKGIAIVSAAVLLTPIVGATPSSGILFNLVLNRATVAEPIHTTAHLGSWNAALETNDSTDVIIQDAASAPGSYSGWHRHLGPVLITVKHGTATMYRADENGGCTVLVYPTGSAFVEPVGPHTLHNESESEVLEIFNAHIIPAGAPQRVDEPDPGNCPGIK